MRCVGARVQRKFQVHKGCKVLENSQQWSTKHRYGPLSIQTYLHMKHFLILSFMSLRLPDDMFTSAEGTAVILSLQCFMMFNMLYLIVTWCCTLISKVQTPLRPFMPLKVVGEVWFLWVWRTEVADRSVLKCRVLHQVHCISVTHVS